MVWNSILLIPQIAPLTTAGTGIEIIRAARGLVAAHIFPVVR